MTNLEIDRRLALAIGYRPEDIWARQGLVLVWFNYSWEVFDYREARTIYPIAERFKMMPKWSNVWRNWQVVIPEGSRLVQYQMHEDPRTCSALAVIEAAERGLLK
jgi:hypothetical protein